MKLNKKAFSLIELLIVITILVIVLTLAYAPYNYYQNKAKLKIATRELSQSLYEARNMAVSGIKDVEGNRSIGLYFELDNPANNYVTFFTYPYDIEESNLINYSDGDIKIIKKRKLQEGVNLKYINGYNNLLIYFESITGETNVYTWGTFGRQDVNDSEIDIKVAYKNSDSSALQKDITYFTNTNIVDYK